MKVFSYARPADTATALSALAEPGARLLAGGTNLVDLMKLGVETPDALVDVRHLSLDTIGDGPEGGLRIGATVTNATLAADPGVRSRYPVLSEALLAGASGQLRNMATTAGNLLQRTRCRYFQDVSKPCNKRRPGSGCPAIEGDHHNHAVLGSSDRCVATHPSDMAVALLTLDAVVEFVTAEGSGSVPVDELYRLPEDRPELDTTLPAGALVTAVVLPPAPDGPSTYRKVRERSSYAFALVSVAAALDVAEGSVSGVRLAFGGVAHRPWRARRAEAALVGGPPTDERIRSALAAELADAAPLRDNAYKVGLLTDVTVAALGDLRDRGTR